MRARYCPGHEAQPAPHGTKHFSNFAAFAPSQRSGLYSAASGPQRSFDVWSTYGLHEITVPSGKKVSSNLTPPLGAIRGKPTKKHVSHTLNPGDSWCQWLTWYRCEDSQGLFDICLQKWEFCSIFVSNDLVHTATLLLRSVNFVSYALPCTGVTKKMVYEAPGQAESVMSNLSGSGRYDILHGTRYSI